MREYLELGPVPSNEKCYATGRPDYERHQTHEMQVYRTYLQRLFPSGRFGIKRFPHDFGSYGEVVVYYTRGEDSELLAYEIEEKLPSTWDEQAKKELEGLQ
jgi:hypothetical protein